MASWWGWAPMWHWLFAPRLSGKPSSAHTKIPSNEKQTWLGRSCGPTALSDFVLNPGACFEISRGYWKMKCKHCGNLLPLVALVKRTDSLWWWSAPHLAKLTVSYPSIPTVPTGKMNPTRCHVGSFELQEFSQLLTHLCIPAIGVELGQTCLASLGHHLSSNKTMSQTPTSPTLSEVCSSVFWWVIWYTSGTSLLTRAPHNLTHHIFKDLDRK